MGNKGDIMQETLSQRLRRLRRAKGLSQLQLAEKIGITPSQVSDYELGGRKPSLTTLEWLCKFFEVTASELLGF